MPKTAQALSARLGLPYSPNLLAGSHPAARAYQDKLTDAATLEAWRAGNGDPRVAAQYYFAGPNRAGWKEKTRRYGDDIIRRMGG